MYDEAGNIVFDPTGGGSFNENGVQNGGHVWFPTYENVKHILNRTSFEKIDFLCYHTEEEKPVRKTINLANGYINRLPREDEVDKPVYSIIVDCYK